MTGAMRQAARIAIDQRRRELVAARQGPRCPTCGGDRSSTTAGCKTCWVRVRNRKRRDDPVYRAAERVRDRLRKQAIRERAAS